VTVKNEPVLSQDFSEPFTIAYQSNLENLKSLPEPVYPIYVPSRGRADTILTTKCLIEAKVENYYVVIEPQDQDSYEKQFDKSNILVMPENNKGIAYVRNFCKEHAKTKGFSYHWQMDDDVDCFKFRKKNYTKNETIEPLLAISIVEQCMDMFTNVAISGIGANAFAFAKHYPVQKNRLTYQCMLINNLIENEWKMGGVEDWYYTFDVLEQGYCTLAFHHIMTQTSSTMQSPGGSTDIHFAGDKRKLLYEQFIKLWPNRFILKEYPDSVKRWRLQHIRKFFNDYKQDLILKK
jgi:hypothetical protein